MNVSDSELITSILIAAGHTAVDHIDDAQLLLFNTCSVREHAEQRVLGRISNELHRKKSNPELKIILLGCMAQRIGAELLQNNSGIDFVVGVDQYKALPAIINGESSALLDFDSSEVYLELMPQHSGKRCGFVTIMRGCNNFCSYCIVPYVRGRERSRPYPDILKDMQSAIQQGLKDITLLGQNVNSYQWQGLSFANLLQKLNDVDGLYRLRFVTSHPKDLSDELVLAMRDCDKVCEHIHLPLQSGSSEILQRMNRGYDYEHYLSRIHKLRIAIPGVAITTDLITGFPGETEAQFEATLAAMREIEYDYAFCFKYSPRSGTLAADYTDQLPEAERLQRLQRMIELQREITLRKYQAQIGNKVEIYVEDFSKKSKAQLSGKTRDFKIAVLSGEPSQMGSLVRATVKDATAGTLICD